MRQSFRIVLPLIQNVNINCLKLQYPTIKSEEVSLTAAAFIPLYSLSLFRLYVSKHIFRITTDFIFKIGFHGFIVGTHNEVLVHGTLHEWKHIS